MTVLPRRAIVLLTAVVTLTTACAIETRDVAGTPPVPAPPAPSRNTAAIDDPSERARFACAVDVQRAQAFDPGASLHRGSLIGAVIGGFAGASLGALFGLIGDIPGKAAATGAIVGGAVGIKAGGLIAFDADTAAYERGLAACLAARATTPAVAAGLVEYRLRLLNVRHEAFASFLSSGELADGAAGTGLVRLAGAADAGDLGRGIVIYDRHLAPVGVPAARTFGAVSVEPRVKQSAGRDVWGEARWYGVPGERTVWRITVRNPRPHEVRRIGLSDATAIAQFRPVLPPLFGGGPAAAVVLPLSLIDDAQTRGTAGTLVDRTLDRSRAIAALVARDDNPTFPDHVYLIVTHATSAATYEAVVAWSERTLARDMVEPRAD
jgi:hypothetical protein